MLPKQYDNEGDYIYNITGGLNMTITPEELKKCREYLQNEYNQLQKFRHDSDFMLHHGQRVENNSKALLMSIELLDNLISGNITQQKWKELDEKEIEIEIVKATKEWEKLCGKWSEDNPKPIALFPYVAKAICSTFATKPLIVPEKKQVRYECIDREMKGDGKIIEKNKRIFYSKEDEIYNLAIDEIINLNKDRGVVSKEEIEKVMLKVEQGVCSKCDAVGDKNMCALWIAKHKCPADDIERKDIAQAIYNLITKKGN